MHGKEVRFIIEEVFRSKRIRDRRMQEAAACAETAGSGHRDQASRGSCCNLAVQKRWNMQAAEPPGDERRKVIN